MCGKSYEIPFLSKWFSKLNKFNLLLTPDPCLTQVVYFCFINSWVLKFLRVAKGFRFSFDEHSGGDLEQEASAFVDIVFRCVDICVRVLYCI